MARRLFPWWCVVMVSLGLATGWLVPSRAAEENASTSTTEIKDDYELLSILVDTLDQVERNYVQTRAARVARSRDRRSIAKTRSLLELYHA